MDIKISLLRTFIAVYEERSISAAAERIHIAQPAVSNRIRQLEIFLDVKLLDRTSTGVKPNSIGREFYLDAVNIVKSNEALKQKYSNTAGEPRGRVRVGLPYGMATPEMSKALSDFQERYPLVQLLLKEDDAGRLHEMLIHQELDFAVSSSQLYTDQLQSDFLGRTEIVMISRANSRWNHLERISVASLPPIKLAIPPSNTLVRVSFDRYFSDHNVEIAKLIEFDTYYGVINLVQDSEWVAFGMLPKLSSFRSGELLTVNPLDPPVYEDICIHQPRSVLPSQAVQLCKERVADTMEEKMFWSDQDIS